MPGAQVKTFPRKSAIFAPASYIERLDYRQIFVQQQPLEIELGAGDGSFLAQWAALHPERNFLGLERLLGRLRKIDRKTARLGLQNVRLLRLEATYFVEYLLPAKSVSAFHIYFPDPWPKRKQRKNRLINGRFAEACGRALMAGGVVYLRTDDQDYFEQMRSVFGARPEFREVETPAELAVVLTDFERGFQAKGVGTLSVGYVKP